MQVEGEELVGAKQNRVVNVTKLVKSCVLDAIDAGADAKETKAAATRARLRPRVIATAVSNPVEIQSKKGYHHGTFVLGGHWPPGLGAVGCWLTRRLGSSK